MQYKLNKNALPYFLLWESSRGTVYAHACSTSSFAHILNITFRANVHSNMNGNLFVNASTT